MRQEQCKSCGAAIFFAAMEPSGTPTPIDWEPVEHGNVACRMVAGEPVARVLKKGEEYKAPRRTSHFATCKDAKKWRRKK